MKIIRPMTVNDAALTSSNVAETDYSAWDSGTTYNLADRVIVVAADVHNVYESLQGSNTGNDPQADDQSAPVWWLLVGRTNRWKMFDQAVQSQTENADSIAVEIVADGIADGIAFLNVSAASINITVTDVTDGEVYNQDFEMQSDSGITDWYAYFFEPIVRLSELVVFGLPNYAGATVAATLTDTGNTAKCGALVLGQSKELGATQYGLSFGIDDYSVKQQDDFGNYTILERAYRRKQEVQVFVDNSFIDELLTTLVNRRATPTVYVGAEEYGSTIIYGFYKDFSTVISYPTSSILNLTLEGLT